MTAGFTLRPTYVWQILWGNELFQPALPEPSTCGVSQQQLANRNILGHNGTDTDEMQNLQLQVDATVASRREDHHISQVYRRSMEIYPCDQVPQNSPMIYERDQIQGGAQQKWHSRIRLFETAYRTQEIFTISVVPKNPSIQQTWYQKRILVPSNPLYYPESKSTSLKSQFCSEPQADDQIPEKLTGFLKPFTAYSSKNYGTDPIFDNVSAVWLRSRHDLFEALSDVRAPELQDKLAIALIHFLDDEEAESMGMIFKNDNQVCAKLFHKSII